MDRSIARKVRIVASFGLWLLVLGLCSAASCGTTPKEVKKSTNRVELAKDFLRKRKVDAAEQEGRKALAYWKGNAEAHNVLGLTDFMRAVQSNQDRNVDQCLTGVDREATLEEFESHLNDAEQHLKTAVKLSNDFGEAWSNRGSVAVQLERYDLAVDYFEKALSYPARLVDVGITRSNLGWADFHRNDLVSAAKNLRQSLQFQPGMCVSTYRLGRVYFARKEWQKSLEKFQAVTADTDCPLQEAHLYLIMTYLAMGAPVSMPAIKRCTSLAPSSCIAARCRSYAKK